MMRSDQMSREADEKRRLRLSKKFGPVPNDSFVCHLIPSFVLFHHPAAATVQACQKVSSWSYLPEGTWLHLAAAPPHKSVSGCPRFSDLGFVFASASSGFRVDDSWLQHLPPPRHSAKEDTTGIHFYMICCHWQLSSRHHIVSHNWRLEINSHIYISSRTNVPISILLTEQTRQWS